MKKSVLVRFNEKWVAEPETGCWLWTGAKVKGYGQLRTNYHLSLASHVSYELHVGEIPDGLQVLHRCDTPACVNPRHLFLGTNLDNRADCVRKGRIAKGESIRSSKLTTAQVLEIRSLRGVETLGSIARRFGVCVQAVSSIHVRRNWRHV